MIDPVETLLHCLQTLTNDGWDCTSRLDRRWEVGDFLVYQFIDLKRLTVSTLIHSISARKRAKEQAVIEASKVAPSVVIIPEYPEPTILPFLVSRDITEEGIKALVVFQ